MASCVIIDTPPVGEVSEALRIAPICDEVLFVARPRHTDRRRLILARELLERADAQMAGMVLVGREAGLPGGRYGYGYSTDTSTAWPTSTSLTDRVPDPLRSASVTPKQVSHAIRFASSL